MVNKWHRFFSPSEPGHLPVSYFVTAVYRKVGIHPPPPLSARYHQKVNTSACEEEQETQRRNKEADDDKLLRIVSY
jgi:hypothetical protein